jgi:hypothetical protein
MGNTKHNMAGTPEHRAWKAAKGRCYNPKNSMFKTYGSRGITMCDEWKNDFYKFYSEVGDRPSPKHSLDRVDNNRGYEPGNVRWATDTEQARNKTTTIKIKICCQQKTLKEWCDIFQVRYKLAHERLKYGWPIEKVLSKRNFLEEWRKGKR